MRTVWRLCARRHAATALGGEGARLYGGRWNDKGTPLVYCASTLSLAMLEALVHAAVLPRDFVAIRIDIPSGSTIDVWRASALPRGWQRDPAPAVLARMGTAWARRGAAVALEVPSAVVQLEANVLLNPLHPGMASLVVHRPSRLPFDARLK